MTVSPATASPSLGYWNAVGIFAALGLLLALGLAARAQRPIWRALAGASVAILAPTFFFTFSRGAWVALAIGLIAAVALDARRLRLTTLFALAPAAVLTVWLGSRQEALTTHRRAPSPPLPARAIASHSTS